MRGVSPRVDLGLSKLGIVVKVQLGVHGQDLMIRRLGQGVDFNLRGVLVHEKLVQVLDGGLGIFNDARREAQLRGNVAGQFVSDADLDVHGSRDDGFGVLLGHALNVHTALRRADNHGGLSGAVHEHGEVEFTSGVFPLADVDGAAETATGACLLGDELVADHLVGEFLDILGPAFLGRGD